MQDLDVEIDAGEAEAAARSAGFEVAHSQLTLNGLCSDCAGR
jgi:Fe2+ or Zn2+ uptake regulation protein